MINYARASYRRCCHSRERNRILQQNLLERFQGRSSRRDRGGYGCVAAESDSGHLAGCAFGSPALQKRFSAEIKRQLSPAIDLRKGGLGCRVSRGVGLVLLFLFERKLFDLAAIMFRIDLFAFGGGFASVPLCSMRLSKCARGWMRKHF